MMKVLVTNTGAAPFSFPASTLITGASLPSIEVAPGATGEICYTIPPANQDVAEAIATWASSAGYSVTVDFAPHMLTAPVSDPGPVYVPPADPLGLTSA